jgi:hypothetical protein
MAEESVALPTTAEEAGAVDASAVEEGAAEAGTPPPPYLSPEDLGVGKTFESVFLPNRRRTVNVRYLEAPEINQLRFLPELQGFREVQAEVLIAQLQEQIGQPQPEKDPVEYARYEAEATQYSLDVAHMAVMPPDATDTGKRSRCKDCGLSHRPSYLDREIAARLKDVDLRAIFNAALQVRLVGEALPFSQAPAEQSSPPPAEPGESTPPTS